VRILVCNLLSRHTTSYAASLSPRLIALAAHRVLSYHLNFLCAHVFCLAFNSLWTQYNYERSTYRWLMARDQQHFSQRGVSTKTLESASRARQAFYLSGWKGAKLLINNEESRFERTPFFETLIKRGLQQSTSFIIESLTAAEQKQLGIQFDSAAGTHFLTQFRKSSSGSSLTAAAAAALPALLTINQAPLKTHATRRTNKRDSSSSSHTASKAVVVPPSPPSARATAAASGKKKAAVVKRKPRSRTNSIDAAASAKEAAIAEAAARVKTEAATHMRR
jgi:hypothetical protein